MNTREVKGKVLKILEQKKGVKIFAVLKKENEKVVKAVNIADEQDKEDTTSDEMLKGFCKVMESTFCVYDGEEEILKLSSADERKNGLYYYDLEQLPEEMELMKSVLEDSEKIEVFDFEKDALREISAFIVIIGNADNKIVLFKQQYPISLLKRDTYMLTPVPHKNRLKKVQQDILRVDFNFQFFLMDNIFYVSDIDKMERICSFYDVIQNEAKKGIEFITDMDILDNVEVLSDELDNISFARKLTKVYKDSKVLGKVPNHTIVEFTKRHSYFVRNPLKSEGDKFILDTKKSKATFIKLLNDDFLKSELTNYEYESLAKNGM